MPFLGLLSFASKLKLGFIVALLLAALSFIGLTRHKINSLTIEVLQLKVQNTQIMGDNTILKQNQLTLKNSVNIITSANDANIKVNQQLLLERKSSQTAINFLAKQRDINRESIQQANSKIDEMIKNPSNDGMIALVLSDTLKNIQNRGNK